MPTVIDHGNGDVEVVTGQGSGTINVLGNGPISKPTLDRLDVSFDRLATEQTWVAVAINWFIKQSLRAPLRAVEVLDSDDDGREEIKPLPARDPLARFVNEPWEGAGPGDLPAHLIGSLKVQGNALAEFESGAGESMRVAPWRWKGARYVPNRRREWEITGWHVGGRGVPLANMLHVAWWAPTGCVGVSPLQQLAWTVRNEAAAVEWALANLLNGARPDGVVQLKESLMGLTPEEKQEALTLATMSLRGAFSGPASAGKLPVMPPDAEWKDTRRTTAVEAALVQQRELNREEVSAVYGLPPVVLGIAAGEASYGNLDALIPYAASAGLGPVLALIEQRITTKWRKLTGRPTVAARFDMTAMLRGDFLREIEAGQKATGVSTWTPQEFRDRMGLRRLNKPNIDDLWVQRKSNVAPMGEPDPDED